MATRATNDADMVADEVIRFTAERLRCGASDIVIFRDVREKFGLSLDDAKRALLIARGVDPEKHLADLAPALARALDSE